MKKQIVWSLCLQDVHVCRENYFDLAMSKTSLKSFFLPVTLVDSLYTIIITCNIFVTAWVMSPWKKLSSNIQNKNNLLRFACIQIWFLYFHLYSCAAVLCCNVGKFQDGVSSLLSSRLTVLQMRSSDPRNLPIDDKQL